MKTALLALAAFPLIAAAPAAPLAPSEIVASAPAADWVSINASDLLVMTLSPAADGKARRVVMQLAPPPFSQGWVGNIRKLAQARWWDGLAIVRVQDNYVVQWGDPDAETSGKARPLPVGLQTISDTNYTVRQSLPQPAKLDALFVPRNTRRHWSGFFQGWPIAGERDGRGPVNWLVHCYGMVGVGRNLAPDTGSGAELYTVIGHAPRHLDRNIALAGRIVQGIEHFSSLPRGTGPLGFYETPAERTPIISIRLASDLPEKERPRVQYLSTQSRSFEAYAAARANRRDAFFNRPAGGADVCNIPVPLRAEALTP